MGASPFVVSRNKANDSLVFWLGLGLTTGFQVPNKATYRTAFGNSVVIKAKGSKIELEWKDERGKGEIRHVSDNPFEVYGLMLKIRLAGYEAAESTPDCPASGLAAVYSMHLPFEITKLAADAATAAILARTRDRDSAQRLYDEIAPRLRDLQYCALTTLSKPIHPNCPFLPRVDWLEAVRSRFEWARTGAEEYEESLREADQNGEPC